MGPFVTRETFRRPDGRIVTWTSRARRKQHSLLDTGRGSTWWAPGAIGWWIGVLLLGMNSILAANLLLANLVVAELVKAINQIVYFRTGA